MDQSLAVDVFEPERNLSYKFHGNRWRKHTFFRNQRADGLAFDILHNKVIAAIRFAEIVYPHQVLMLQLGTDTRFTLKPRNRSRIVHSLGRENLERYLTIQTGVPSQINSSHSPLANQVQQHVAINLEATGAPCNDLLRLPQRQCRACTACRASRRSICCGSSRFTGGIAFQQAFNPCASIRPLKMVDCQNRESLGSSMERPETASRSSSSHDHDKVASNILVYQLVHHLSTIL